MNTILLDFSKIRSMYNLHAYLKDVFKLPDYYGFNMDALWDCLQCSFEDETTIILKGLDLLPEDMQYAVPVLISVFEDLKKVGDIADYIVVNGHNTDVSAYLI